MQCRSASVLLLENRTIYTIMGIAFDERRTGELFLFVRVRLQECVEVTHRQIVAPNNTHVRDVLTILVQSLTAAIT